MEEKELETEKNLKSKAKMAKRGSKELKIDKEYTKLETGKKEKNNIFKKSLSKKGSKELEKDIDKIKNMKKGRKKEEQKEQLTEVERLKAELELYQKQEKM